MLGVSSRKAISSARRSLGSAKNDCAKQTNYSLLGSYKEVIGGIVLACQQIVGVKLPLRKYERFQQVGARLFV
jgi:hypothetical protein